jgi:DNA mismatch repair protein MutH
VSSDWPADGWYLTAPAEEIQSAAARLRGRQLDELQTGHDLRLPSSASTKGVVGRVYETYFGIPQNSVAGPDFPGAGIELKSVPILRVAREDRAKERISLGMIDWDALGNEVWPTAKARQKLEHLMLIFYDWHPLLPLGRFRTLVAGIWEPDIETLATLEQDWLTIQGLAVAGRRAEVSESLTRALGAATKGPGHGSISRAWSLKQPFVGWIYRTMAGVTPPPPRTVTRDPEAEFESLMAARFATIESKTVKDVAEYVGMPIGTDKSFAARVIRTFAGQRAHGRTGEFDRFGVELKTVPLDVNRRPVESMSFPSFVHEELQYETWEDSDLLGRLNRLLIVPINRAKGQAQAEGTIGRAFFWSPREADLVEIAGEWERYRSMISAGLSRQLPTAAETKFIHVRPKARNAADREIAPGGFDVTRKSFWLNVGYVERIIRDQGRPT